MMKPLKALTHRINSNKILAMIRFLVSILVLVGALNFETMTPVAHAAGSVTVDRTDDPNPVQSNCTSAANDCSLRGAVVYANAHPGTEIVLTHGATYTLSIAGPSSPASKGDLNLTENTKIDYDGYICMSNCTATIHAGSGFDDRIFSIDSGATVTMTAFIIRGADFSGIGGGIYNAGTLTLQGVTVRNNTVTQNGGGIYNISGTLNINDSNIIYNTSSGSYASGGGIYNYHGTVNITNSSIANNSAGIAGGGIMSSQGSLTLTNTDVTTNTASTYYGGGIDADGPITINGGSINGNTTTGSNGFGGGLYYSGNGTANITDADISGNSTTNTSAVGGGISANNGTVNLTNTTVTNNTSTNAGGISFSGDALNITGSSISNNSNGGINVYNAANLTMSGSTVDGNTSTNHGAGLYLATTSSSISSSTFTNNSSTGSNTNGGGIYFYTGDLTIENSTFSGNLLTGSSSFGGGITISSSAELTLNGSTINGNAANIGAGLYSLGTLNITNCTLSGNTATTTGGGLSSSQGTTTLTNVTITANQALSAAGVTGSSSATLNLRNSLIAANTSTNTSDGDCGGPLTSLGYNLIGAYTCSGMTNGVNGDMFGTYASPLNPRLDMLDNNGGSTLTHALLQGSPAINAGDPNNSNCPTTDQRGSSRPIYSRCDIGAYEYTGPTNPTPQISSISPTVALKSCSGYPVTLTVNGSYFLYSSVVRFNGADRPTTYVSANQLTALIADSSWQDTCTVTTNAITVFSPSPGGGTSNSADFTVSEVNSNIFLPIIIK
jgi:hypothetical protein